ncbi:hypothetical protein OROMI_029696 [Orobanche minor]
MCKVLIHSYPKSYSYTKMWKSSTAKMMRVVMIWWLLWVAPVFTEADEYMIYKDPKQPLDARLEDLMTRMTLEEKIGQMTQIERIISSPANVTKYLVGSVMSSAGSYPSPKASVEDWVKMVNDFQKGALSTRLGIPIIYGTYAVHGHNNVYGATIFPHNIGIGVTRDPVLVKKIGAATALELRATGIPFTFAPDLSVCRDPRWGSCYLSYSEDTNIVRAMTEIIPGLQGDIPPGSQQGVPFVGGKTKVAACAMYFVGDGGTDRGIDEGNTTIDFNDLLRIHMPPYLDSIAKGVATVMVAYSSLNGQKMHANRDLVTNYLKNKLQFKGFVNSAWKGIDRITDPPGANYSYSVQAGVLAGIDMVMLPENFTEFIYDLNFQVKNKIVPMSRINDAVQRILRVKFMMGLFENPLADLSLVNQLGSQVIYRLLSSAVKHHRGLLIYVFRLLQLLRQEHRELAREAVRRSLVLLKNGKNASYPLLPLQKKVQKVLVAGTHADNLGYQCGGYTEDWQGVQGNDLIVGTTILNAVKKTVDPSTQVVYTENPKGHFVESQNFSYAIVVVGEVPYAEMFGDSKNLSISEHGRSTIKNVCEHVRCVVIIVSGRPVEIQPDLAQIDALVAAWLPGTEGQGVADVLFGDYGFTGKLARTWFKSVDQLPMNVGDPHYDPLFPFGFGLTTEPTKGS